MTAVPWDKIIVIVLIVVLVFFLIREVVCWYLKLNRLVSLLEQSLACLTRLAPPVPLDGGKPVQVPAEGAPSTVNEKELRI